MEHLLAAVDLGSNSFRLSIGRVIERDGVRRIEQIDRLKETVRLAAGLDSNKVLSEEAIEKAGVKLVKRAIRGGTDGSRLSFMGLPCPNIFAGEHAFHSREEWVSLEDMMKSMEVMKHLAERWANI
jgi:acetylornithine deacetylase/succinyl-diaminopimelate desuccinylase-like protein